MQKKQIDVRLMASNSSFRSLVQRALDQPDISLVDSTEPGSALVLLDFPITWALSQLDDMNSVERGRTVVLTQSSHGAYTDAVASFHVSGVVTSNEENQLLSSLYAAASSLKTYQWRSGLTYMELRVTRLLLRGLDTAQIAQILRVSAKTVNAHVSNVLTKLGYDSRAQYIAALLSNHVA